MTLRMIISGHRNIVLMSFLLCSVLVSLVARSVLYIVVVVLELLLDPPGLAHPPFMAELSESEDDESEKLDSCVTSLATSYDGEDNEDELDSYGTWRRLSG